MVSKRELEKRVAALEAEVAALSGRVRLSADLAVVMNGSVKGDPERLAGELKRRVSDTRALSRRV